MDKNMYYQAKRDSYEDVMSFMAILLDQQIDPKQALVMLDAYVSQKQESILQIQNDLQNG